MPQEHNEKTDQNGTSPEAFKVTEDIVGQIEKLSDDEKFKVLSLVAAYYGYRIKRL